MMHSATRASARATCRRGAASAKTVASHQQQRAATSAAASMSLCRGRSSPLWTTPPQQRFLGRMEAIPPPSRRGFASAVATFEEGVGEVASAAETCPKEEEEEAKQTAESKPKPRRRRLLRDRPAPITMTDRAAAHLISLVVNKPGKVGVRLGVKRRGCNGMSYTLKYADEKPEGDEEVVVQAVSPPAANSAASTPQRGASGGPDGDSSSGDAVPAAAGGGGDVRLFVDPMATLYIAGTVMDWEETELASEFTFTNPNAKGECGCGESFNV